MSTQERNQYLDHIEGLRFYVPPPNHLIIETPDVVKSKKGIHLPHGGKSRNQAGEYFHPVGKVVAMGALKGEWAEHGAAPCAVGDTVLFHVDVLPISRLHGRLFVMQWDMVYLTVSQDVKRWANHAHDVLPWEPEEEESTLVLSDTLAE